MAYICRYIKVKILAVMGLEATREDVDFRREASRGGRFDQPRGGEVLPDERYQLIKAAMARLDEEIPAGREDLPRQGQSGESDGFDARLIGGSVAGRGRREIAQHNIGIAP